jgi:hypothetical protein
MITRYDIFSGTKIDAMWLGTAAGLVEAVSRMEQQAHDKPGPYFVFDSRSLKVVASVPPDSDESNAQLFEILKDPSP